MECWTDSTTSRESGVFLCVCVCVSVYVCVECVWKLDGGPWRGAHPVSVGLGGS